MAGSVAVGAPGVMVAGGVKLAAGVALPSGAALGVGEMMTGKVGGAALAPPSGASIRPTMPNR